MDGPDYRVGNQTNSRFLGDDFMWGKNENIPDQLKEVTATLYDKSRSLPPDKVFFIQEMQQAEMRNFSIGVETLSGLNFPVRTLSFDLIIRGETCHFVIEEDEAENRFVARYELADRTIYDFHESYIPSFLKAIKENVQFQQQFQDKPVEMVLSDNQEDPSIALFDVMRRFGIDITGKNMLLVTRKNPDLKNQVNYSVNYLGKTPQGNPLVKVEVLTMSEHFFKVDAEKKYQKAVNYFEIMPGGFRVATGLKDKDKVDDKKVLELETKKDWAQLWDGLQWSSIYSAGLSIRQEELAKMKNRGEVWDDQGRSYGRQLGIIYQDYAPEDAGKRPTGMSGYGLSIGSRVLWDHYIKKKPDDKNKEENEKIYSAIEVDRYCGVEKQLPVYKPKAVVFSPEDFEKATIKSSSMSLYKAEFANHGYIELVMQSRTFTLEIGDDRYGTCFSLTEKAGGQTIIYDVHQKYIKTILQALRKNENLKQYFVSSKSYPVFMNSKDIDCLKGFQDLLLQLGIDSQKLELVLRVFDNQYYQLRREIQIEKGNVRNVRNL